MNRFRLLLELLAITLTFVVLTLLLGCLATFVCHGAQQTINVGTAANAGDGDSIRTAFGKANANFSELYGSQISNSSGVATNLSVNGIIVSGTTSNQIAFIAATGKLGSYAGPVSVRWFGAVGDGTDETSKIQAAITAAANQITLDNGTYVVGDIAIPSNKTLIGPGTIKYKNNTAAFSILISTGATNITFRDITFDGNTINQSSWDQRRHALTILDSSHVLVEGCNFINLIADGIYISHSPSAVAPFTGSSDVRISGCSFVGSNTNRNGISVVCGRRYSVIGNYFEGMAGPTMPGAIDIEPDASTEFGTDGVIANNIFIGCRNSVSLSNIKAAEMSRHTISGNLIFATGTPNPANTCCNGINIVTNSSASISGNSIVGMVNGIYVSGGKNYSISGNSITNSVRAIHVLDTAGTSISGNAIDTTVWAGIRVERSNGSSLSANAIRAWAAGQYGIDVADSDGVSLALNSLDGISGTATGIHGDATSDSTIAGLNRIINCSAPISFSNSNHLVSEDVFDEVQSGFLNINRNARLNMAQPLFTLGSTGVLTAGSNFGILWTNAQGHVNSRNWAFVNTGYGYGDMELRKGQTTSADPRGTNYFSVLLGDNAGRVGLGTTNPVARLHVAYDHSNENGAAFDPIRIEYLSGYWVINHDGTIQRDTGPKIRVGTGVPSASDPNGSIFLRSDGGTNSTFYVRESGAWTAK